MIFGPCHRFKRNGRGGVQSPPRTEPFHAIRKTAPRSPVSGRWGGRWTVLCGFLFLAGLLSACAVSVPVLETESTFPTEVFVAPAPGYRAEFSGITVRPFAPAPGRPETGHAAAEVLARELARAGLFETVRMAASDGASRTANESAPALEVTGRVLHWLDGGPALPGRLETEIRVHDAASTPPRLLWWARHLAESGPVGERDLIFFRLQGRPAKPAGDLLAQSARVYGRMMAASSACFPPADPPRCPEPAIQQPVNPAPPGR